MIGKQITFDSSLLYESLLFRVDFDQWPNGLSLFFRKDQATYRLRLSAILRFHYETRNLGEFAQPFIECYFVGFVDDDIRQYWEERVAESGLLSSKYTEVFHLGIGSNLLGIEEIADRSIGASIVCRDFSFWEVYELDS